jgi:hypothetical protein
MNINFPHPKQLTDMKLFHQVIDGKPTWKLGEFPEAPKWLGFAEDNHIAREHEWHDYTEQLIQWRTDQTIALASAPSVIESDYEKVKAHVFLNLPEPSIWSFYTLWTPEDKAYSVPNGLKLEVIEDFAPEQFASFPGQTIKTVRIVPESAQTTSKPQVCKDCIKLEGQHLNPDCCGKWQESPKEEQKDDNRIEVLKDSIEHWIDKVRERDERIKILEQQLVDQSPKGESGKEAIAFAKWLRVDSNGITNPSAITGQSHYNNWYTFEQLWERFKQRKGGYNSPYSDHKEEPPAESQEELWAAVDSILDVGPQGITRRSMSILLRCFTVRRNPSST